MRRDARGVRRVPGGLTGLLAAAAAALFLLVAAAPAGAFELRTLGVSGGGVDVTARTNGYSWWECPAGGDICSGGIADPPALPPHFPVELPVGPGGHVDLTFDGPVKFGPVQPAPRPLSTPFGPVASLVVLSDRTARVTLPTGDLPPEPYLFVHAEWDGPEFSARGDFVVGLRSPAQLFGVTQTRGGAPALDLDARAPGRFDVRITVDRRGKKKTLGRASWSVDSAQRRTRSVPLSSGARKLLAGARKLRARAEVVFTPRDGAALRFDRALNLRAAIRR